MKLHFFLVNNPCTTHSGSNGTEVCEFVVCIAKLKFSEEKIGLFSTIYTVLSA